jgi:hypothetical protein
MDGFRFGAADVVMTGTEGLSPSYSGQAGEFAGTARRTLPGAQNLRFGDPRRSRRRRRSSRGAQS